MCYALMQKNDQTDAEELKFENLKGVFLVLLYGSIFASLYGCIEALLLIYKKATSEKVGILCVSYFQHALNCML